MAISAKDLANLLNISPATVSMVLNNRPGISKETKDKVLEGAKKYGFDLSKKHMVAVQEGMLHFMIYKNHGSVVSDTPFFSQVTEGIQSQCRQNGYHLQISYLYKNEDLDKQLESLIHLPCKGIILLGTEMSADEFILFKNLSVPLVVLDSYFEAAACNAVCINNVQGAYLAVKHLVENGHTQIGYLHSSLSINNFTERQEGYLKALGEAGITEASTVICPVHPTMEGAYKDLLNYLTSNSSLPTAFFADNDIIAMAAIRAFKETGYNVPEDISVIGFDDMPLCEYMDPPLSTVLVQKDRLGALAVERLLYLIDHEVNDYVKIELSTALTVRKSVKNQNL
ncbi:LacI family transcriptional regulator [Anaerocolumna cellulosilytica]|uniref:LacI family transcriptional regulator n=1 Tax=Anaerocolumna cellulosilytica TaxID=433286 RepID=A0A6S6R9P2_9FIRM|nr:LacI family DNA-binding transcriptional regulator [Anaerocolumna cellulosilytica]MBB5195459.1 LacI family transcriptional regulator [Anaerocolumna cellulosilytica]BCJ95992.1 LacI family transcriptional regulator [Anaerocolumna cellulosilytica]